MNVTLCKSLARSIRQGHPWIYRDALAPGPTPADGDPVLVHGRDRRPLVTGFWDGSSAIAVRVLAADAPLSPARLATLFEDRARAALDRRLARLDRARTSAFRWIHGEADGLPGIHVDLYDDVASVRHDGAGARAFYGSGEALAARLRAAAAPLPLRAVVDREDRAGGTGASLVVREEALLFGVDLGRGQKGGLFLDQRENRALVREHARDRDVLNLFGYTGAFSVYAAAGGARSTTTVDVARPAIEEAARNFDRNGLPRTGATFVAADAFAFLEDAARHGRRWDLVISDPPSFAPRRDALPAARRAYRRLHRLAAAVTAPGGLFCPASCSSHFPRDEFLASVDEGVRAAGRRFTLDELRGAGLDHPVLPAFPEGDYLKFAVGRLERG